MNADGSGQRKLTRNPARDGGPAWSPDGRRIAFASERNGTFEIYVMNADGSGQRSLTGASPAFGPEWSPDGRKIVFFSDGEIYAMNADGSEQRRLTRDPGNDFGPRWSPDGHMIAFERDLPSAEGEPPRHERRRQPGSALDKKWREVRHPLRLVARAAEAVVGRGTVSSTSCETGASSSC